MAANDHEGLYALETLRFDHDRRSVREDWVIEETPVALLYNGLPFAVMMATPADLEDFALGFALCEGVVETADEFRLVDRVDHLQDRAQGIALHAAIPQQRFDALAERQRSLEGRSGCGLCGVSSLEAALRPTRRVGVGPRLTIDDIQRGFAHLAQAQPLNAHSGGAHAAAFIAGKCVRVREDVGRHNAVDKLVGALHRDASALSHDSSGLDAATLGKGALLVTSRASYEIVQKAANAGIAIVAAMSAPTALAIHQAEAANITLAAFAREGRMNVYSVPERIV